LRSSPCTEIRLCGILLNVPGVTSNSMKRAQGCNSLILFPVLQKQPHETRSRLHHNPSRYTLGNRSPQGLRQGRLAARVNTRRGSAHGTGELSPINKKIIQSWNLTLSARVGRTEKIYMTLIKIKSAYSWLRNMLTLIYRNNWREN